MNPLLITQIGGVISVVGIALFIIFAVLLLTFPVGKQCDAVGKCKYEVPASVQPIVNPGFLAASLMVTAAGILAVRLGRRTLANQAGPSGHASR